MNSIAACFLVLLACVAISVAEEETASENDVDVSEDTECVARLRLFPMPDVTWTAKHLKRNCPELCKNSSGSFPTGQFPHPWDCSAFVNCYNNDAWVHWCQVGLRFNENNIQCDYPRNVNCDRSNPKEFKPPAGYPSAGCVAKNCKKPQGQFPIPGECSRFVNCWNGTCAYITDCPSRMVFNEAEGYCDNSWSVPRDDPCYKTLYGGNNAANTLPPPADNSVAAAAAEIAARSSAPVNGQDQDV